MVPVEPISLSIGIAALFTTCIDCFEYFKAAKDFEQHFEVLLVKLEYQQERLLVWGDLVGICNEQQQIQGPISESKHKSQLLTKRCLDSIHHLLKDTENLKTKYGLRAYNTTSDTTAPHSGISTNALKRFRLQTGRQSQGPSVFDKTRWAIHDETKFQKLVEDIRDLIDGLETTIPVSTDLQEQKVQDDIASMVDDIQSLHLFQEACKDDYPMWWTAASAAIDASEVATLDNRLADERLEHYDNSNPSDTGIRVNGPKIPACFGNGKVYLDTKVEIMFVLTESCRVKDSETPCDQSFLGEMAFAHKNSFIAPGSVMTRSAPGYRMAKYIHPDRFTYKDLKSYIEDQQAIKLHAIANDHPVPQDEGRYRVSVYIYCPPCACQIATAIDICTYRNKKDFVNFCIRIDHRQKTCCSTSVSRIEGLISVVNHLKEEERNGSGGGHEIERLKAVDREWLERQIYDYTEEDRLATPSPTALLEWIATLHRNEDSCAAIILLGEADYCVPLMEVPPFPPFEPGRLPRETWMVRNFQHWVGDWHWERDYIGTYTAKNPLPPRRPTPVNPTTTETLESAQRGAKRPRSLTSDQEGP